MIVPSSDLLGLAFSVIASTPFKYFAYRGRSLNEIGLYVSEYFDPIMLHGSIQAVSRSVYQERGLDFQKQYIEIWVEQGVFDISRDTSGDQVEWMSRRYQLTSESNWFAIDGWVSVLAVQIDTGLLP
jgi:hypothetical protein